MFLLILQKFTPTRTGGFPPKRKKVLGGPSPGGVGGRARHGPPGKGLPGGGLSSTGVQTGAGVIGSFWPGVLGERVAVRGQGARGVLGPFCKQGGGVEEAREKMEKRKTQAQKTIVLFWFSYPKLGN